MVFVVPIRILSVAYTLLPELFIIEKVVLGDKNVSITGQSLVQYFVWSM